MINDHQYLYVGGRESAGTNRVFIYDLDLKTKKECTHLND